MSRESPTLDEFFGVGAERAEAEALAAAAPKWKCPKCGSTDVQISLPAWFTEDADGNLTHKSTDEEADVAAWYCEDCNDSDHGEPERVDP